MYYAMSSERIEVQGSVCVCVCVSQCSYIFDSIQKQSEDLYLACTVEVLIVVSSLSLYTDPIACIREATNSWTAVWIVVLLLYVPHFLITPERLCRYNSWRWFPINEVDSSSRPKMFWSSSQVWSTYDASFESDAMEVLSTAFFHNIVSNIILSVCINMYYDSVYPERVDLNFKC